MKDQIDLNTLFAQSGEFPFDSESAVCFTGPRPANLPDGGGGNSAAILEIGRRLDRQIRIDIAAGKTVFINGAMSGFDVMAGEAVLRFKQDYPAISCVTVAPFQMNYFGNDNWTPEWKKRALDLYWRSDLSFSLSKTYHARVYFERDEYMVDHSSALVCYYNGAGEGTKYTLDYALKKRLAVRNLALPDEKHGGSIPARG